MQRKLFLVGLCLVLFVSLVYRIHLVSGDNLFFTVDQGRDAVYVREILHGRLFLKGPETNIRGVFAGPLFYYFTAIGYFFSGGHPVGGVWMIILTNLILCGFVIFWLERRIGKIQALTAGLALQLFWPFVETSLWSFNPFPLVALSFLLIYFLIKFLNGKSKYFYLAITVLFLAFNAEVAGAIALTIFSYIVGFYGVRKRFISAKAYLVIGFIIPLLGVLILARQFIFGLFSRLFNAEVTEVGGSGAQVFSGINFLGMLKEFVKIVGSAAIPQNYSLGILLFIFILILYWRYKKTLHSDISKFISLTIFLTLVSYIFFSLTLGWRSWQTVYLPPLLFISTLLIFFSLPKKIGLTLFALVMILQYANFRDKYLEFLMPSGNPSLLYNQLSVVDWVYRNSQNLGFKVYNYTDTFYDYPYQYLFWWRGLGKYGYLPEEYSNFPLSHKSLYVPESEKYSGPARSGINLKYLIIQSNTNGEENKDWPQRFKKYNTLIDQKRIGDIIIEKYASKNEAPSDLCIWWQVCELK